MKPLRLSQRVAGRTQSLQGQLGVSALTHAQAQAIPPTSVCASSVQMSTG